MTAYMLSALYSIARPSVRIARGWISQKLLKLWYPKQGVKQGRGWELTNHFVALNVNISKTVGDMSKVTISD